MNLKLNPKYTKVVALLLFILVLYQLFRFFTYQESPPKQLFVVDHNGDSIEKVKVSVYYEALCPDSKYFVDYQLMTTFEKLRNYLVIDLVPYGKAQTIINDNGEADFDCQHGPVECQANKIHACVIHYIKDEYIRLKFIACMISENYNPEKAGRRCSTEANFQFEPILQCANGIEGSNLLKAYGERTHGLNPAVSFIPTIELNESQTVVAQPLILKDLTAAVCQVFKNTPPPCL